METLVGKALNDLANIVADKWYSGLGAIGLITLLWVLLKGTPHDDLMVGCIALAMIGLAMIGLGFGEAETRTSREHINLLHNFKITGPARRLTFIGICLYLTCFTGLAMAALRAMTLG